LFLSKKEFYVRIFSIIKAMKLPIVLLLKMNLWLRFPVFITQEVAEESIQALADTELQIISRESLEKLYEAGIHWQEIGRKLTEMEYVTLQKRMISFQKLSGKQRYEDLYQNHQKYIQLIPLQYLASYLGVTPRHLSRIRKAIL
jgi:hypothetical protein